METVAAPLTDDERQEILRLIETGKSAHDIAKEVGRSVDTVSRIAKSIGWTFGLSNMAQARASRSAYCAEARAEAAAKAQERLLEILDTFDTERPMVAVTKDGPEIVMVGPDARAVRDLASAVQTLQRTVLDIDKHDRPAADDAGKGLLERIAENLERAAAS